MVLDGPVRCKPSGSWHPEQREEIVRGDTAGTKFCMIGLRDGEVIGGAGEFAEGYGRASAIGGDAQAATAKDLENQL